MDALLAGRALALLGLASVPPEEAPRRLRLICRGDPTADTSSWKLFNTMVSDTFRLKTLTLFQPSHQPARHEAGVRLIAEDYSGNRYEHPVEVPTDAREVSYTCAIQALVELCEAQPFQAPLLN